MSMVIWMTGLSGSGKSTIAETMMKTLKPSLPELVLLEGDIIRELFGQRLDYSEKSRIVQVKRLRTMAKFLSEQGLIVVVTVLYCHPDLMAWNRDNIPEYFEVYVDTPLDIVIERDVKGLYGKAKRGEMPNVVGLDVPWYAPDKPDLHLKYNRDETSKELSTKVINSCPRLNSINA
jgi:cytidine diphosphoramidate kinase